LTGDEELEILMRKKYLKLQRMLMAKRLREQQRTIVKQPDPEEVVRRALDSTGRKVLDALKAQYPREAKAIIKALARAILERRVPSRIDGGMFYRFLLSLGLRVRLETKIYVERKGEVKEFSEYLRERLKDSQ